MTKPTPYKCRLCGKPYSDVVGGDNAFGKRKARAACIPCFYAEQIADEGLSIEQIEAAPDLLQSFTAVLAKTGWTWQDMKESADLVLASSGTSPDSTSSKT